MKKETKKVNSISKLNKPNYQPQKGNKTQSSVFERLSKFPNAMNITNQSHNSKFKEKNSKEMKIPSKKNEIKKELNTYSSEVKLNNFVKEEFKSKAIISGNTIEQINNKNIDNRLEKLQEIIKKVI